MLRERYFRDRLQANRAARVLLGTLELDHLWEEGGPTERAEELIAEDGGPLAPPEAALLLATDVLCGEGTPQPRELTLRTLLRDLSGDALNAFLSLVLARLESPSAVEAWLVEREARRRSPDAPQPTQVSPAPLALREAIAGAVTGRDAPLSKEKRAELRRALSAALLELETPDGFRIPLLGVVRRLEAAGWARAAVHRELLELGRQGELQLYPAFREGLPPEEAEALPEAFRGSVYVTAFRSVRWRDPCARCGLMAQAPAHDEDAIGDAAHAFEPKRAGQGGGA